MDYEAGSHPSSFMTLHELSRHRRSGICIRHPFNLSAPSLLHLPRASCLLFIFCVALHDYSYHNPGRCVLLTVILSFLSRFRSLSPIWISSRCITYALYPPIFAHTTIYIHWPASYTPRTDIPSRRCIPQSCTPILVAPGVGSGRMVQGGLAPHLDHTMRSYRLRGTAWKREAPAVANICVLWCSRKVSCELNLT